MKKIFLVIVAVMMMAGSAWAGSNPWKKPVGPVETLTVTGDLTVGGAASLKGVSSYHSLTRVLGKPTGDSSIGEVIYSLNGSAQGTSFNTGDKICATRGLICADAGTVASVGTSSTCTTTDPTGADTAFMAICTNSDIGTKISETPWRIASYHGYLYITSQSGNVYYSTDGISWDYFSISAFCTNAEFGDANVCAKSYGLYHDETKDVLYMGMTANPAGTADDHSYIAYCKKTDNTLCDTIATEWKNTNIPNTSTDGAPLLTSLGWDAMERTSQGMLFGMSSNLDATALYRCTESVGGDASACDHANDYSEMFKTASRSYGPYDVAKIVDISEYGTASGTKYHYLSVISSGNSAALMLCDHTGGDSTTYCDVQTQITYPACDATCASTDTFTVASHPFVDNDVVYTSSGVYGLSAYTAYVICNVVGNTFQVDTGSCAAPYFDISTGSASTIDHLFKADADWSTALTITNHNQSPTGFAGVLTSEVTADNKLLIGWGGEGGLTGAYVYQCDIDTLDANSNGKCDWDTCASSGQVGDVCGDWTVLKGANSTNTEKEITQIRTIDNDTFILAGDPASATNREGNIYLFAKDSTCNTTKCLSLNLMTSSQDGANRGATARFYDAVKHSDGYVYFLGMGQDTGVQVYRMPVSRYGN